MKKLIIGVFIIASCGCGEDTAKKTTNNAATNNAATNNAATNNTATNNATTNNTATNNATTVSQSQTVSLFSYRFNPNSLSVRAGTTVVFENRDPEQHNVRILALGIDEFIDPQQSWSYVFTTQGEFLIENSLSTNDMKATIIVE